MSPCRSTRLRNRRTGAFTLIEVLVVVAIIALLVSILIPSLIRARDQSKRVLCTSNFHQQLLGMSSYAADYKGYMPWRGWFSYDVSESRREAYGYGGTQKVLVNLALLIGKHLGKNWDMIYCPSTIDQYKDGRSGFPPSRLLDTDYTFTSGGYNYALPMGKRVGSPRLDLDVYPRDVDKLDSRWLDVLKEKANKAGIPMVSGPGGSVVDVVKMMPRRVQPVVMDFVAGGGRTDHRGGLNVGYSDGHARFKKMPKFLEGGGISNTESFYVWYEMTVQP